MSFMNLKLRVLFSSFIKILVHMILVTIILMYWLWTYFRCTKASLSIQSVAVCPPADNCWKPAERGLNLWLKEFNAFFPTDYNNL